MYAVERQTSKVHSSDASSPSRRAANFLANLSERSNHRGPNLSVPPSCVSSLADGGSFLAGCAGQPKIGDDQVEIAGVVVVFGFFHGAGVGNLITGVLEQLANR